ncbi:hypothetical protein [Solidesulfovibrio sp.]|uniref:hypothetical protein n=1 Tax=Solidesulfovibrio sp. TaxID=2910990 RepID=UPI002621CFB4|nr:hypothetical protein [Solidesulfovibrio sp.]
MKHRPSAARAATSLDDLAALMAASAELRRQAAAAILAGKPVAAQVIAGLAEIRDALDAAVDRDGMAQLAAGDDQAARLDLSEETAELENDVLYLEEGREALLKHVGKRRKGLRDAVRDALRALALHGVETLLCQSDALFRAPGQRFVTAVQPAWNAVALGRYAAARAARTVLWSAAPLSGPGLADLRALPRRACALAGSGGRQILDAEGRESAWPMPLAKASLLESINARLAMLLADPEWRAFAFMGSGLQFRRGETVVARQDDRETVGEDLSRSLLEHIHDIVDAVDPEREHFRVEDDGRDVVVTPTTNAADAGGNFSAGDGLRALEQALGTNLAQGPHLLCCAGADGIELLEALLERTEDVACLFVGDREDLGRKARELCPRTALAGHPDTAAAVFSAAAP